MNQICFKSALQVSNPRVKIGSYLLGSALTDQFTSFTGFTSDSARPRGEGVRVYAGLYYHSNNLWQPEVTPEMRRKIPK